MPYVTVYVSIFEGDGRTAEYRRINPTGTVPAIQLEDGRTLAESNAILTYLADGTPYLPDDAYGRAKVAQWLSFEQERVEMTIGSLRYWTMTGKIAQREPSLMQGKRAAWRTLGMLEQELALRPFLAGDSYTIADIAVFAYASRAGDADISLEPYPHFRAWIERVQAQPGFLAAMHPYAIDPHSAKELPAVATP